MNHVAAAESLPPQIRPSEPIPSKKAETTFHAAEVARLHEYLVQYRDVSLQYCAAQSLAAQPSPCNCNHAVAVSIGGYDFPPLNSVTCTQPFLQLPANLTPKHRKLIHDICFYIDGIYHVSLGPKTPIAGKESPTSARTLLISIFVDGFEYHKTWSVTQSDQDMISFPVMRCKSWFYLNHDTTLPLLKDPSLYGQRPRYNNNNNNNSLIRPIHSRNYMYWSEYYSHIYSHLKSKKFVQDETNTGLRLIKNLIEHPGQCIRDNMDSINLDDIHDLSHVPPPCNLWDISEQQQHHHHHHPSLVDNESFLLVDTVEKLQQCIQELNSPYVHGVAFDVEAYNRNKWTQVTCLVQLSSNLGKDYILDVLAPGVWDAMSLLKPLFANPAIVKVGHNIGSLDISSLHRDFGILVVNAFDTQVAAESLQLKGHLGLAKLCEYYGLPTTAQYQSLKQVNQMRDWRYV